MKMSSARYEEIKTGMKKVVDFYGKRLIQEQIVSAGLVPIAWRLFHATTYDFMYSDNHPAFVKGRVRINPYKEGWNIYNDDLNDAHIETALKKIAKELELFS